MESLNLQKEQRMEREHTFSTVKRAHSPFRKLLPSNERGKSRDASKIVERPRPSRPPLPPRSPYIEDDSLHDLHHKLRDISSMSSSNIETYNTKLPPLPPCKTPFVEENPKFCLDTDMSSEYEETFHETDSGTNIFW